MRFSQPATRRNTRLGALAAAAIALLMLGAGIWWQSRTEEPRWAMILVDDHLHSVPAAKPSDITSGDPATVREFFEQRVSFAPVVPDLPQARLLGGRLCT